ncbi:uncharacterized protein DC041_0003803 [Schistosoma bovis]|uniref:P-type ATPase A domain-containing protein n=1 Tax=Schistosoma bovis TaxID=6184 RepID=A0A430QAU3_SCHBO|nr:uncharacterized protein DC041_0003803 [Schistosoma bovis]
MSLSWQVYELRRNEKTLKETMCISSSVIVYREEDGVKEFKEVDSISLVPGDIIEIPQNGCLVQCDAILLAGNCIVNESTLTDMDSLICEVMSTIFLTQSFESSDKFYVNTQIHMKIAVKNYVTP